MEFKVGQQVRVINVDETGCDELERFKMLYGDIGTIVSDDKYGDLRYRVEFANEGKRSVVLFFGKRNLTLVTELGQVTGASYFGEDIAYSIRPANEPDDIYVHESYIWRLGYHKAKLPAGIAVMSEPELNTAPYDMVYEPRHYNQYPVPVVDIIEIAVADFKGILASHYANVIKYVLRAPFKGNPLEDLKKAHNYLGMMIEKMEKNNDK